MEQLRHFVTDSPGKEMCGRNLVDEMKELEKLRTAVMMEKCLRRNEIVLCPKPRKQSARSSREPIEMRAVGNLSNILLSKASPPFYSGSPPIRSDNPVVHDIQQPILNAKRTKQKILSMV